MPNPPPQTDEPLRIPTGDELYNMLMGKIEPELTTSELARLDEKYKNETPNQAKERAARYEKAFAEYDRQLADYLAKLQAKVREYQTTARQSLERDERQKENQELAGLEQAMGSL